MSVEKYQKNESNKDCDVASSEGVMGKPTTPFHVWHLLSSAPRSTNDNNGYHDTYGAVKRETTTSTKGLFSKP